MPTRIAEDVVETIAVALDGPDRPDVGALLAESDAWYAASYPAESNHLFDVSTLKRPGVAFFTARCADRLLGCGAIVEQRDADGDRYGEIKRMYVAPAARGMGLGRLLLETLEGHAAGLGLRCVRLETGVKQPEAIGLYKAFGYVEIAPFGDYAPDPLSLFMEKRLC